MYCIFFALQSCSQMDFLFISDGRLGRDRFVSPFQNCVLAKNPQPLTFTFLLYIIHSLGGQRSTETREREKRGKGRGDESIGSRCALIVVLLELMDECCYQKARNVCLLTNYFNLLRIKQKNNGIISVENPNFKSVFMIVFVKRVRFFEIRDYQRQIGK